MSALLAVARKELRQIARDRRTLMILLFVPAFFLFLYGYALNFDIRHVALAVEDRDGPRRAASSSPPSSAPRTSTSSPTWRPGVDASPLIERGEARASLVIPGGVRRPRRARREHRDPGDHRRRQRQHRDDDSGLRHGRAPRCRAAAAAAAARWRSSASRRASGTTPSSAARVFLVPGLIAFIAMITAVISTALSIVREKEHGTMEQVRMAPISTASFVARQDAAVPGALADRRARSSSSPRWSSSACRCTASWVALSIVIAVFLVGALGTGVLISTVADSQQVAFQAAALIAMLPTLILSGFIFPIASMPIGPAVRHDGRAGEVFPDRAARRRPQGARPQRRARRRSLALGDLRDGGARAVGRSEAGTAMMRRIRSMMWKEFLELRQTPRLLALLIVAPIVQLTMLGYAATTDVHHVPIVVVDGDRTPRSRALLERFSASRVLRRRQRRSSIREPWTRTSPVGARGWRLSIPPGFEASLEGGAGRGRPRRCRSSPTAPTPTRPAWRWPTRRACRRVQRGAGGRTRSSRRHHRSARAGLVQPRASRAAYFMVPGVLAMLLLLITTNLVVDGDRPRTRARARSNS